jgi:SAM-dependent methyltransferase
VTDDYWNHNVHYYSEIVENAPPGARVLDIGCGNGLLARRLGRRGMNVLGIDTSATMVRTAQESTSAEDGRISFVEADFLDPASWNAQDEHFDYITAVASIHHIGLEPALSRICELLTPGGRLYVLGIAEDAALADAVFSRACQPSARWMARKNGGRQLPTDMPFLPPDQSWREIRQQAACLLPGSRFRRRLLFRYSLTWNRPEALTPPSGAGAVTGELRPSVHEP